ncbi:MAG TPA: matrixin family metalloprotease [Thermoanaerobaculia bacterium]|jgi:hypothetical protein
MSPRFPAFLLALLLTLPTFAATRMMYEIKGTATELEWAPTAFPLPYEVDQRLAQLDSRAQMMVDRAFAAWTSLPDANIRFESRGLVANATAARSDGRVVVSVADDLFANQGALALTTYTFDDAGRFTDADIQVDPSLFKGTFNAQMALEHEVGHVLGLDHSAVLSAVMYPFVGSGTDVAPLDSDDRIAIAQTYPRKDPTLTGATLQGRVYGDSGAVFGAQVVALNERGEPVATALTAVSGEFTLAGVPTGRYRLYAEPLDGPVDARCLQGMWRRASSTSFPTQFFAGPPIEVESGKVYGNLSVNTAGAAHLNPRWIGATPAGSNSLSLSTMPLTLRPGQNVTIAVGGDGFTSGMTEFEVLNPALRRVSGFVWDGNYVKADFVVQPDAANGSAVIEVRSGREAAMLTGALRIQNAMRVRAVRH